MTYAEGRENASNARPPQTSDLLASSAVPDARTGATARYTEVYVYDAVSNPTQVTHTMVGNPRPKPVQCTRPASCCMQPALQRIRGFRRLV